MLTFYLNGILKRIVLASDPPSQTQQCRVRVVRDADHGVGAGSAGMAAVPPVGAIRQARHRHAVVP